MAVKNLFTKYYFFCSYTEKLYGVGPVDNRPSTKKHHHLAHFFKLHFIWYIKKKLSDMQYMTGDR